MTESTLNRPAAGRSNQPRGGVGFFVRFVAAVLAFGAQGVHLALLQEFQRTWWGYGLFFLIVAMAQGILGVSLLFNRPSRLVAVAGIIGNGALVALWLITRLGGIPGLYTFERLPIAGESIAPPLLELALIGVLAGYLWWGRRTFTRTALTRR